jgi:hypothetical protein
MAESMQAGALLAAAGFVFYVAVLATALRLGRGTSPAVVVIAAALLAYVAMLMAATGFNRSVNFWVTSTLFWFPTMIVLMGFGALYKSVSLRILLDLLARPGHAEPYSAILQRYIAAESFENRLTVILESKWAIPTSAGYALTARGRRAASIVAALQGMFAIRRSG